MDSPIVLRAVACPLLVVPFAQLLPADKAGPQRQAAGITLSWPGVRVLVFGDRCGAEFDGDLNALSTAMQDVTISLMSDDEQIVVRPVKSDGARTQISVDDLTWQTLNALAHRTYVPASEASRELGAG